MSENPSFLARNLSRREALKATVLFSSSWLAEMGAGAARAEKPMSFASDPGGLDLLAFGDYGTNNDKQRQVAARMEELAGKLHKPPACVLALGDNFYGKLLPDQFEERFEKMYSVKTLNCPFYALLGNHDYGPDYDSGQWREKADMQLDYARLNPASRWKMPAKWHSFHLPDAEGKPLVKLIYLDGNIFEGALRPQEKLAQKRWLEEEFDRETEAPWTFLASHYPIFSETLKRTDKARRKLLEMWEPYLRDDRISLYLAGHDHNLQHLRVEGFSPDFVISGGGGASRYDVGQSARGFSMKTRGFVRAHVNRERLMVQYINTAGDLVHSFERQAKVPVKR